MLFCTAIIIVRHHSEALNDNFDAGLNVLGNNRRRQLFPGMGYSGFEMCCHVRLSA